MEESAQRSAAASKEAARDHKPALAAEAPPTETERFVDSWESPMLLVFWQPNCPGCEHMEPMVSQVQRNYPAFRVLRINTRAPENERIRARYSLRGTPTFVVTLRGGELRRNEGGCATFEDFVAFAEPWKIY
jgi:thiol-disulfide isomerase/thioredoxin